MRTNLSSQFDPETIKRTRARVVERNTFERFEGNTRIIRLHATDIVKITSGGRVTLDSGGYRTKTTRERMNSCLPSRYSVHTANGLWSVHDNTTGAIAPYIDGIKLPGAFTPRNLAKLKAKRDAEVRLRERIKHFSELVPIDRKPLPLPNTGDCFACQAAASTPNRNKYFGYPTSGPRGRGGGHIRQHIHENYMPASLIWAAIKWSGYNPQYHWGASKHVRQMVRRYVQASLGLVTK